VLAATLEVPLVATSVAEWNAHNHLSGTLKRMQAVFDEASAKSPCVLFIDELDGISSRLAIEGRYSEYWTQIVNRMLELTTETLGKEGVVIVGATNHPNRIDPALTRSGRLDQIIHIPLPDEEAIVGILQRYVGPSASSKDLQGLAPRLVGKTGADIEKLVRSAKAAARRAGRSFWIRDLQQQVPNPLDKLPPQVQRRIRVYRNGQRIVAEVLGLAEMIPDRHSDLGQLLAKAVHQERFPTEQMCNDILAIIMAGRASEEIVFGDVSVFGSGVSESDLAVATTIAKDLEMRAGFGETGVIYLGGIEDWPHVPATLIASIRRRIEAALTRASTLLIDNVEQLQDGSESSNSGERALPSHLRLLN
jgi:ATP-dependent Zn protease